MLAKIKDWLTGMEECELMKQSRDRSEVCLLCSEQLWNICCETLEESTLAKSRVL
jgi:hypothetical protein